MIHPLPIRPLFGLALRLTSGSSRRERYRSIAALTAAIIASTCLLHTFAATAASASQNLSDVLGLEDFNTIRWVVVVAIALPSGGLIATTCRLSAEVRDRRLASLRVLGLTAGSTRLVATIEAVLPIILGAAIGSALFLITRPVAAMTFWRLLEFPSDAYHVSWIGWLAVLIGLPALASALAFVAVRSSSTTALSDVRRTAPHPRVGWRLTVLAIGVVAMIIVITQTEQGTVTRLSATVYPISAVLTVIGVVVTAPIVSRLIATSLIRLTSQPAALIAARRLQSQPARSSRILTGMLVALFCLTVVQPLATGAESDPVYQQDHLAATSGPQTLTLDLPHGSDLPKAKAILADFGVNEIEYATMLHARGECFAEDVCLRALVTTCAGLEAQVIVNDCRDGEAFWLNNRAREATTIDWVTADDPSPITLALPQNVMPISWDPRSLTADISEVMIPATTELRDFLSDKRVSMTFEGPGGISVEEEVQAAVRAEIPGSAVVSTRAFANYVQTRNIIIVLRAATWTVLGLGLLAFAFAGIDQILGRRLSITNLLLVGVPRSIIRRAQAYETLLPLIVGLPVTLALGGMTGRGSLAVGYAQGDGPWSSTLGVALVAIIGSAVGSLLLVAASVPQIDASNIRQP